MTVKLIMFLPYKPKVMGVNSGLIRQTGYKVITLGGGYKSFIFMSVIIS